MDMGYLYNKKGFFLIIIFFIIWVFISSYWYVCGVKNFCSFNMNLEGIEQNKYRNGASIFYSNSNYINNINNERSVEKRVVSMKVSCTSYIKDYLGKGNINKKNEVAKLQNFLNEFEGNLLFIDGFFGSKTKSALIEFQRKNNLDEKEGVVLGFVKKTTRTKINEIYCRSKAEDILKNN